MAKSRAQKESLLESYKETLSNSDGFIAVDVKGVDTLTVTELKKSLKQVNSNLVVVKNKLFQIALQDQELPTQALDFAEQTAIIPYSEDPTAPAKMVKEVQKETEALQARYGVIKGEYMVGERVMQLAEIPSREELLAKMLGSMTAPVKGFMNVVTGNVRGFVQVVHQLSEQKA